MRNINIAKNIADLRKRKGITQEQLAGALCISPQAVSKWETGTSSPDVQTLPLIADFFGVSIDYLFYGLDVSYDEIYDEAFSKVASHPQMSKESYEDAHKLFGYAHHGISRGNIMGNGGLIDAPTHISNENGVSLLSGKGFGAIVTRAFFEGVGMETANLAADLLSVLSDRTNLLVVMAIMSMSDISFGELSERLGLDEAALRRSIDSLTSAKVVVIVEKKSKHKSLGYTYEIAEMYHTCLCILVTTLEMQRLSLKGISCCMGFGDYPIAL